MPNLPPLTKLVRIRKHPTVQILYGDVEQCGAQRQSLVSLLLAACQPEWKPLMITSEHEPWASSLLFLYTTCPVWPQFVQEQAVLNCVQHFLEVHPNNTHYSLHMDRKCCLVERDQISQVWLAFVNLCRLNPVTCLVWLLILFKRAYSVAFWESEANISGLAFFQLNFWSLEAQNSFCFNGSG